MPATRFRAQSLGAVQLDCEAFLTTLGGRLCLRLGQSCSEIDSMIQEAFGNKPVGRTQVTEWFRLFKKGTDVSHK